MPSAKVGLPPSLKEKGREWSLSMPCPECSCNVALVIDVRQVEDGIRRRRVCRNGHRYTTYERAERKWSGYEI